jgi:hypothetical protein
MPAITFVCQSWPATRATKLFPTFLTLLGGPSGRLVTDAQLFSIQFNYDPDAAPQITIAQWIPAFYLPVTTPGTGFDARTDLLNTLFFIASRDNVLDALKRQQSDVWYYRFDWDCELGGQPARSARALRDDDAQPGRVRAHR